MCSALIRVSDSTCDATHTEFFCLLLFSVFFLLTYWHSCGCHFTYTARPNTIVEQVQPIMAMGLPECSDPPEVQCALTHQKKNCSGMTLGRQQRSQDV